jgi:hypothetical protein
MKSLAAELQHSGYVVHNLDYSSTTEAPDALLRSVSEQIRDCCRDTDGRIHFVTHSLGGILVRAYLNEERPANLGRAVLLAPPNAGSEIVDSIGDNPVFAAVLGPTGQTLGTGPESLPKRLPAPDYEVGIIAGSRSINPIGSAIIPGDDDGTVSIESAKLPNAADFLVVDATHTFIMQDTEVARQTIHFLRFGRFAKAAGSGGACNAAKNCLLHQDPPSSGEYVCLPPRNECEANYLAGGCNREACEATPGCSFVPGHCFCPSGVQCVCGGGPPPECVPTSPAAAITAPWSRSTTRRAHQCNGALVDCPGA